MAERQWYVQGMQFYESGEKEYYVEGVQINEDPPDAAGPAEVLWQFHFRKRTDDSLIGR